ncbi:MAG: hypothetical protein LBP67_04945 [Bacteroidales bacterium]|jgi:hypothetical protein|nr:hypothetical protein [Bacteroidales bacterium]
MKTTETITISAFSEDYSEKAYKFYFANNQFEFVPKSQVKFLENSKGGEEFGEGIESRYFELPTWLFSKLKGVEFYGV